MIAFAPLAVAGPVEPEPTPTVTETVTPTPTPTVTATATVTATPTPTAQVDEPAALESSVTGAELLMLIAAGCIIVLLGVLVVVSI